MVLLLVLGRSSLMLPCMRENVVKKRDRIESEKKESVEIEKKEKKGKEKNEKEENVKKEENERSEKENASDVLNLTRIE